MPDFEALIKQQQLKQPESENRLKIVNSDQSNSRLNEPTGRVNKPKLIYYFLAGFSGSLLATISLLFLYENHLISLEIEKIISLISSLY